jgi:hypothetical protein
MVKRRTVPSLKAEIAKLYGERAVLMADMLQNRARAHGFGDPRALDEKTKEHLTFEIVHLIASWDGGKVVDPEPKADGDISVMLSAIVELEESIFALECELPES